MPSASGAEHAEELARYARLTSSCDALESFSGCRPRIDDDVFDVLARRRSQVADLIAHTNLQAYEQEAPEGLYLAIPFFSRCSDKQPVLLLNRTNQPVTTSVGCCIPVSRPGYRQAGALPCFAWSGAVEQATPAKTAGYDFTHALSVDMVTDIANGRSRYSRDGFQYALLSQPCSIPTL